ncbi:MAG: hypothetical protein KAR20_04580 [Candidatus Heimdallarchaeota archaeon]|nr:hypothetical protein [Candidatus Heimdallarchaeota archaeon]
MDYTLLSVATEITKPYFPNEGINFAEQQMSIKYLKEKVALLKFHLDWIRVDMEEDGV